MQANSNWKCYERGLSCGLVLFGIIASFWLICGSALAELKLSVKPKAAGFDLEIRNATSSPLEIQRVIVGDVFQPVNFTPQSLAANGLLSFELKLSTERFLGVSSSAQVTVYANGVPSRVAVVKVPAPPISVDMAGINFGRVWLGQRPEMVVAVKGSFDEVTCADESVSLVKLQGGNVQVRLSAVAPGKVRSYLKFKAAEVVYKLPIVADVLPVLEVIPAAILLGKLEPGRARSAKVVLAPGQSISDIDLRPNSALSAKIAPGRSGSQLHVAAKDFNRDIDEFIELRTNSGVKFSVRVTGIAG